MNTPICDFVKKYSEKNALRLHMPGHKGKNFTGSEHLDITEIEGADVLYSADGIIKESMENASSLFSSAKTLYSTEGSTLSIRAMLFLTALYAKSEGKSSLVLAGRNAHKAFISAAALNDLEVEWLYPKNENNLLSCRITPEALKNHLEHSAEKPTALYITSPDYLGNTADIKGLAAVCKAENILLLVDNAHGAYLQFLPESTHPLQLGADMCCDSAHKTLPVLTGGGYLHISKAAPEFFAQNAEKAMSLFASTSPSYLIMESLDYANKYLAQGYKEKLESFSRKICELKAELIKYGYYLLGDEVLKITIATKKYGYEGRFLAKILEEKGIFTEFADKDFLVMMLSPETSDPDLEKLRNALLSIEKRPEITAKPPVTKPLKRALSIREAVFSSCEEVDISEAAGRILGSYAISCPPAIPIAVCGEVIDENAIAAFEYYETKKIQVVK